MSPSLICNFISFNKKKIRTNPEQKKYGVFTNDVSYYINVLVKNRSNDL
jgi:hypothetical protein